MFFSHLVINFFLLFLIIYYFFKHNTLINTPVYLSYRLFHLIHLIHYCWNLVLNLNLYWKSNLLSCLNCLSFNLSSNTRNFVHHLIFIKERNQTLINFRYYLFFGFLSFLTSPPSTQYYFL